MERWQRRRILIWGKTRPEVSKKYREIVCTGGVFEDTRRLVRIYPVPLRYMDDSRIFKKYQWIEAEVMKAPSDPRPESYKIRYSNIRVLGTIPSEKGNWDARARWVMNPENIFSSVETLKLKQRKDKTSLGLVKPKEILDIQAVPYSDEEQERFWAKYQEAIQQMELPLDFGKDHTVKPLRPPDYRFRITFRCDDHECSTYRMSVLDWEVDALYFNLRQRGDSAEVAVEKVIDKLHKICGPDKDLYFFLGNIASHPQVFSIVGFWWPKKKKQLELGI